MKSAVVLLATLCTSALAVPMEGGVNAPVARWEAVHHEARDDALAARDGGLGDILNGVFGGLQNLLNPVLDALQGSSPSSGGGSSDDWTSGGSTGGAAASNSIATITSQLQLPKKTLAQKILAAFSSALDQLSSREIDQRDVSSTSVLQVFNQIVAELAKEIPEIGSAAKKIAEGVESIEKVGKKYQ